nr:unnamed protein product [Digitaria exilis]
MSWLARSIAATLSSAHSDDDESDSASGDKSPPRTSEPTSADAGESDEQPDTPSRGVKGDISELTETLTRRFWGILQAREELLQSSTKKNKVSSENMSAPSTQSEDSTLLSSSIQNESGMSKAPSVQELTSDPVPNVEAEKHPISTPEAEVIDKTVIQEELVVKTEVKSLPTEKSKPYPAEDDDEQEVDDWLQDMDHVPGKAGNTASAVAEEDVSFSDLEDD